LRDAHLDQLTQDHSLQTDVLETRPDLDEGWLDRLPKNVVTRALGVTEDLRVSVRSFSVVAGDRYLLCSDGLSTPVNAGAIAAVLAAREPPEQTVAELIALANAAGGPDNIAVIVIDCEGGHDRALPASASYPPASSEQPDLDPELLILGIEELELDGGQSGRGGLLTALGKLLGGRRDEP
jgi:protein phosphatase